MGVLAKERGGEWVGGSVVGDGSGGGTHDVFSSRLHVTPGVQGWRVVGAVRYLFVAVWKVVECRECGGGVALVARCKAICRFNG